MNNVFNNIFSNIKLSSNWKAIVAKAYSIKMALLAGIFSGVQIVLPLFVQDFSPVVFASLSFICAILVIVSRVIAQKDIDD